METLEQYVYDRFKDDAENGGNVCKGWWYRKFYNEYMLNHVTLEQYITEKLKTERLNTYNEYKEEYRLECFMNDKDDKPVNLTKKQIEELNKKTDYEFHELKYNEKFKLKYRFLDHERNKNEKLKYRFWDQERYDYDLREKRKETGEHLYIIEKEYTVYLDEPPLELLNVWYRYDEHLCFP